MSAVVNGLPSATTMASLTPSMPLSRTSIFWGAIFFPYDVTRISFLRPLSTRLPAGDHEAKSPVQNQPSASTAGSIAATLRLV